MTDVTINAVGVVDSSRSGGATVSATAAFTDLSFEQVGSDFGLAAAWAWNRRVSFRFAHFVSALGWTRLEGFERGWGADTYIGALVAPTNAQWFVFGASSATPGHDEHFERGWRMPATPAPDISHPGNETASFVWDAYQPALFDSTLTFESFEVAWHSNEAFIWSFISPELQAAVFDSTNPFESFEAGWKSNDTYAFTLPSVAAAQFTEWTATQAFEDFSAVLADQAITFSPPNTINVATLVFPLPWPGSFPTNMQATFYNAGNVGALPPEIDSRLTYFVVLPLLVGGTAFEIAKSAGGSALTFSAGSGNNFYKGDTSRFWTLTDVGI